MFLENYWVLGGLIQQQIKPLRGLKSMDLQEAGKTYLGKKDLWEETCAWELCGLIPSCVCFLLPVCRELRRHWPFLPPSTTMMLCKAVN